MKCGKVAESGITALGGLFHPECFVCECGASLVGATFFPAPDGKSAMCGACKGKDAPKCAKCGEGMSSWTEAMGKKYHPACFVCSKCGGDVSAGFMPSGDDVMCRACGSGGGGGEPTCSGCNTPLMGKFAVKDGKPLCDACMTKASPPTGACSVCSKPVTSGIVVMGAAMHPECFGCGGCGTSMNGKSYAQVNGKAMCTNCAAKGGASRGACCKCGKDFAPADSITQSLNKLWHPECFTCGKCNGPVNMSGFQVADGNPVCANCSA